MAFGQAELFTVIRVGNIFYFLVYAFIAILYLWNYSQLKIKDHLILAVYFLSDGILVFLNMLAVTVDPSYFFFSDILFGIFLSSLFLFAVRMKWTHPPKWIYGLSIFYIYQIFIAFFTTSFQDRVTVEGSLLIPFMMEFTLIFLIYAILTSKTSLNLTEVKQTKFLWLTGLSLHLIGSLSFLIRYDIPGITPDFSNPSDALYLTVAALAPQYLAVILFGILHIFYPQAILITNEQLNRASNLFKLVEEKEINSDSKIGSDSILDYLQKIKEQVDPHKIEMEATRFDK